MVSRKTKINYGAEKLRRAGGKLLPIFSRDKPSDLVNEILREDEDIRLAVVNNPFYREFLEKEVSDVFKDYRGIIYGARVVDSWDRVTSSLGLIGDAAGVVSGGLGNVISAGEEIVEGIPKGIYALYYGKKTGDWKAIPLWALYETASFIPGVGDLIDMTNIYVDRARYMTKNKVKENFKKKVGLEGKLFSKEYKLVA